MILSVLTLLRLRFAWLLFEEWYLNAKLGDGFLCSFPLDLDFFAGYEDLLSTEIDEL